MSTFVFIMIGPESYYAFALALMFWLGISFEFPLVVYILVSLGLIRAQILLEQARLAIVIAALIAAVITPTTDPANMLLVWIPLIVVYYIGVGLAFIAQRGMARQGGQRGDGKKITELSFAPERSKFNFSSLTLA